MLKSLKIITISLILLGINAWPLSASAAPLSYNHQFIEEPDAFVLMTDALLVRPIMFAATALGAGVFLVSLPLSIVSNSVPHASQKMVVEPWNATFRRCFGCDFHYK